MSLGNSYSQNSAPLSVVTRALNGAAIVVAACFLTLTPASLQKDCSNMLYSLTAPRVQRHKHHLRTKSVARRSLSGSAPN